MRTPPEEYGIDDYLAVLRRRKWHILLPVGIILMAGILILQFLQPVYRATASITIDKPDIPSNLIEPTVVAGYVEERLAEISRKVLTSQTLLALAKRYELYPEYATESETGRIVQSMRDAVHRETVNIEVTSPRGKTTVSAIAINLSFDSKIPEAAQKVANELAHRYVTESERQATEKAKKIADFIQDEAGRVGQVVNGLETKLAEFKRRHADELPEAADRNRDRLERIREQLDQSQQRLQALGEQKISLEGAMASTPKTIRLPGSENEQFLRPEQRIANLSARYLQMSTRYASEYPDLLQLRSEIETLSSQVPGGRQVVKSISEFERLRNQLSSLRESGSGAAQEIERLTSSIEQVRAEIASGSAISSGSAGAISNNPNYLQLKTRLDSVRAEINAVQSSQLRLQKRLGTYRELIARTPDVEKEFRSLRRDYENTLKKYRELQEKVAEARLAQQLENERKGERLSLANTASLPSRPVSPNQLGILALSILFGFVGGLGNAALAEYRSDAIYGAKDLVRTLGLHPLASIPIIEPKERPKASKTRIGFLVGVLIIGGFASLYLYDQGSERLTLEWIQDISRSFFSFPG